FREAFQVFPELRVLLHELLLRYGQLVAQEKILERVPVQDVIHMQGIAPRFEIEPEVSDPQTIKRFLASSKLPERLPGMRQISRLQVADGIDGIELRQLIELVELTHRLFGKCHLIHDAPSGGSHPPAEHGGMNASRLHPRFSKNRSMERSGL